MAMLREWVEKHFDPTIRDMLIGGCVIALFFVPWVWFFMIAP